MNETPIENLEPYDDEDLGFEEPKKGLFNKILNFVVRKDTSGAEKYQHIDDTSVFENIANSAINQDITRENHLKIREAASLSEEALKIFKQKILFLNRSNTATDKMSKMEIFNRLGLSDIDYLKMILNRYQSLMKEKNIIDAQLQSYSRNVVYLSDYIDDAKENISKIEDAEKTQRMFRTDLNHIEGEKEELLDEMDDLITGRNFFKKFAFAFISISVVFMIVLSFMGIFYNADIFMPLFILVIAVMGVGTFLFYMLGSISKRMKLNIAYQKRAVELLNKKNVVYVHYTNFLKYEYNKYRCSSSAELRQNMREVEFYRQTLRRYGNVRSVVKESEVEIYKFLDKNQIKLKISLLRFAESMNIDEQRRHYDNLNEEKEKIETILNELDEKYELIISRLNYLSELDSTPTKVIREIVNTFYSETEKIVSEYNIV